MTISCKIRGIKRLTMRRGIIDVLTLTFEPIELPDGFTMEDLVFYFYVSPTHTASHPYVTKTSESVSEINIDAENDAIHIKFNPEDTAHLQAGTYYWSLRILNDVMALHTVVPDMHDGDLILLASASDFINNMETEAS